MKLKVTARNKLDREAFKHTKIESPDHPQSAPCKVCSVRFPKEVS